ncbi:MAG: phosphoesterase [Thermoanaerobaculia bacterium]|nr:phosphoesterase [Thermoanaerobaculia bacterium]
MSDFIDSYPLFDELYCISDLHLGGEAGFQMFSQGELLGDLFRHLAAIDIQRRVVLVINGDFIDFLAEAKTEQVYLDTRGAVGKLRRVFGDPSVGPALAALAGYLGTDNRFLAITLGNHDLELALPDVREELVRHLAGGDASARGRLFLALDGTGFTARVGQENQAAARVVAVHGNDADPLNVTDHEALRRVCLDLSLGRAPDAWNPNAGTKLVIDLMNGIKERYPFVDLLKPEMQAVVPTLTALDPQLLDRVPKLWGVAKRAVADSFRRAIGLLGGEELPTEWASAAFQTAPYEPAGAWSPSGSEKAAAVEALLANADHYLARELDPVELAGSGGLELLGPWGLALDLFRKRDPKENLRETLEKWLDAEPQGSLITPDKVYRKLGLAAGSDVEVVLTGHTHKPRAMKRGNGLYFNSGAWADRIVLTRADLTKDRFEEVFNAFRSHRRQALDDAGLVRRQPLVVWVAPENGKIVGQICEVVKKQKSVSLKPLEGSRLEVEKS